ncbi:hypothetical protein ABEO76_01055 [Bacillus anthracis]|uniref:hypothetical protein n=1 Tax=Bacillus anthracis TaxID=1392 RepID=UPI003D240EB2
MNKDYNEDISSIHSKELKRAKKGLKQKIESLDEEIKRVNERMENKLNPLV